LCVVTIGVVEQVCTIVRLKVRKDGPARMVFVSKIQSLSAVSHACQSHILLHAFMRGHLFVSASRFNPALFSVERRELDCKGKGKGERWV